MGCITCIGRYRVCGQRRCRRRANGLTAQFNLRYDVAKELGVIMATEQAPPRKGNRPILTDPPPQWLKDYTKAGHHKFNEMLQDLERDEQNAGA